MAKPTRSALHPYALRSIARGVGLITAALLFIPAVAMRFTDEVNWGPEDFAAAGLLILGSGLACTLASRLVQDRVLRLLAVAGIVLFAAAVCAHLAVDLSDSWPL